MDVCKSGNCGHRLPGRLQHGNVASGCRKKQHPSAGAVSPLPVVRWASWEKFCGFSSGRHAVPSHHGVGVVDEFLKDCGQFQRRAATEGGGDAITDSVPNRLGMDGVPVYEDYWTGHNYGTCRVRPIEDTNPAFPTPAVLVAQTQGRNPWVTCLER